MNLPILNSSSHRTTRTNRQVGEPMIGHMKADGLLDKNWLKGANGDALHALLCGAGHNLRMILRHLRVLYCGLVA